MGTELIPAVVCSLVHTLWSMSAVMTCYEEDDAVVDKKRKRKTKKHWNEKAITSSNFKKASFYPIRRW